MIAVIFANPHNDPGFLTAAAAAAVLSEEGCAVRVPQEQAASWPEGVVCAEDKALCVGADLMVVLGGDGTILRAAQLAVPAGVPMLGINMGRKGFLAEVERGELDTRLRQAARGEYAVEKRFLLRAEMDGTCVGFALNDFYLLSRAPSHRMLTLAVEVDGASAGTYAADGMLVATPTGSTGYSLSAGGPVIAPEMECMALTPICAHMLRARPMVLAGTARVTMRLGDQRGEAALFCDGSEVCPLNPGQSVSITRFEKDARFVRFGRRDFYGILKEKFSEWTL
ncbi:MAG: NAD(+)/NADH kinase [Eubacteriales bacterium]|nr:NAD(+)/NADH kinase [Eubacteriales bacterium]